MHPETLNTPLRTSWNISGHPTSTLWWPSRAQQAETVLLFIPGNPGLIEYYADFLEQVYRESSPGVEIYGVSHLGMSPTSPPNKNYTFQEQIDHKVSCVDMLQQANSDARIIIVGHSIGAYLAAQVVKQRPTKVSRVFALFPCLYDIGKTPNGLRTQRVLLKIPHWVLTTLGTALSYLPARLLEGLLSVLTNHKPNCIKVTASLCNGSYIRTVLRFAQQEMRLVRDLDYDFYKAHIRKFIMYYSPTDRWAPIDQYRTIKAAYPDHEHFYLCEKGLQHSFSIDPQSTAYMAHKVVQWLSDKQGTK